MQLIGRAVSSRKLTVEEVKALDISRMRRRGFFRVGASIQQTSSWTRGGKPAGTVSYFAEHHEEKQPRRLTLSYRVRKRDGDRLSLNYSVEIVPTPCHFGGAALLVRLPARGRRLPMQTSLPLPLSSLVRTEQ
jgi:hypothetical protein